MIAGDGNRYLAGFAKLQDRVVVLLDGDELLDPDKLEEVRKGAISNVLPPRDQ